ncbi:glycosyltransferase [Helicobacter bilis]|uniref:glycosyltransferase n=1 Tax=Helicobacter bilis TaxID=37372 RepID=UPI00051D2251|nr:glycosyltransferase [Helicobacter bilis]MDD7297146.1 glycosyltransferase [Helicobacter bilis]MDY4401047.1 glycosyltransferase [Helicobacter bilis]TLE09463.1 glycosyltransferase family 4 protein [Helicobacter bilis]
MKIVLSIRNLAATSGVERVVVNLASALCDLGHEVEIACYYKDELDRISTFPVDSRVKISYIYPYPDNHTQDKGLRKVLWKWFRHLIVNLAINAKYTDADIFIESDFFLLFPYIKRKNMKYIRIIHVEIAKWKRKNNLFDKVVVLSSSEYAKWQHKSNKLIRIFNFIPMPFDTKLPKILHTDSIETYNPYESVENLLNAKKILLAHNMQTHKDTPQSTPDSKVCKIIAVGQMQSHQKGFPRMVSAYSKIARDFPNCMLEITGKGHKENPMNDTIKELDLQDFIKLNAFTTNIESVYLQGDIYAMTSYFEGLPMALIEAMSYGLPIVAYDIGTIRDCFAPNPEIKNGVAYHKNGILVPDGDENLLCEAMRELLSNEAMRLEMGRQSLILAKERFSKEVIMQEWQDLLTALKR